MPVIKVEFQSHNSLEEFYLDERWQGLHKEISAEMLEVIDLINEVFNTEKIYAFTSHQALCLVNNSKDNDWGVQVYSRPPCIFIQYKLPLEEEPWENALVLGDIIKLTEQDKLVFPKKFQKYLITAMVRSKKWDNNSVISNKLQSFNI